MDNPFEPLRTHYPKYDVMHEQEHWDEHTREIVVKRFDLPVTFSQLTGAEVECIRALTALFVDDSRLKLLDYVVKHYDSKLASTIGEDQRKAGTPPEKVLIRDGLAALETLAQSEYSHSFTALSPERQTALLVGLERDTLTLQTPVGTKLPAPEFFKKMLTESVSAYYSHPLVWSEIGYGGPAYPRGYVRSEFGLTDPWEAKRDA
ncbi:gluconate 2-dehydrogenase subunit 3 family protein [Tumebacillus permanentifrigoris]|uniref:Gluconate 2-dehydrogenase subunit 3-like protein n=1 Tax=Tumebacillus permanentifrigoris TaxID=378543 RepID=A0A316D9L4_9BACL|nr:gluconate 2-dehydrogenase subunit 3 family protein [Tumebacillus permanentifrigoris]PWK13440.1 gluconate 2-dehydrogenase subunit 3-like protein [Tumebacillus permanentifrigoris]